MLGIPVPEVSFDCGICFHNNPKTVACFIGALYTICFRSNFIPENAPAHEVGHAFAHYIKSLSECHADVCETFAKFFEVIWEANRFNFGTCQVCGSSGPWSVTELGDIACQTCQSTYGIKYR